MSTPALPPAHADAVLWRLFIEAYSAEAKLAPSTIERWPGNRGAREDALRLDDPALVTPADLIAGKRDLLAAGRAPSAPPYRRDANPAVGDVMMVPDKPRLRGREFTDGEAQTILRAWRGNIRLDDLFIGRGQVEPMGPRSASPPSLRTMAGRRSRAARLTSQSAMPAATWLVPVSALGRGSCITST